MFSKLGNMEKEIKIPKGIVMMLKSFGFDAKAIEQQIFQMGKDAITLLRHCDERLTSLANQHQLLHAEKEKLVAEVARLHSRFDSLEQLLKERLLPNGNSTDHTGSDTAGNRAGAD